MSSTETTSPTLALGEVDVTPEKDDLRFYSVTTILKALDKPALQYWSAEEAARCAIKARTTLGARIKAEGEDAVVKWIRDARFRAPKDQKSASELGTAVHKACETYALTGVRPDVEPDVEPFLERFDEWAQVWQPEYEAAEAAVYNKTYGYAGTLDAIFRVDGMRVLVDYKSSRKSVDTDGKATKPYPETALQVAAYRHAEILATWRARRFEKYRRRYYLLSTAEEELGVKIPEIDGAVCLHITPEHCDLYPVRADYAMFEKFLHVIEVFDWQQTMAKAAIGQPLAKKGA